MAKNQEQKKLDSLPKGSSVESGVVGTEIFDGTISFDYEKKWKDRAKRLEVIDNMRFGDSSVSAVLDAVKGPLLSANWYSEAGGPEPEYKEHAEFVGKALFNDLEGGWDQHLIDAVTCLDFGFAIFEKIWGINDDGKIVITRLAPRVQKSIEKWGIDDEEWVDGHPTGITQMVYGADEIVDKGLQKRTIPWNKILRFSFRATGNNFEGQSILRPAYKNWYFKDVLHKVVAMAGEKFGVGIPWMQFENDPNDEERSKAEEILGNIRSNEKAFLILTKNVKDWGIKTPDGTGNMAFIQEAIRDHDQKIYDSILAGFLRLGGGSDGGSFALSRDQSSFFLRAEQWIANFFCNVYNTIAQEMVYMNYGPQKVYPKIKTSDIGQISIDEYVKSIAIARTSGLISWGDTDEGKVREQLRLPGLSKIAEESSPRIDPSANGTSPTMDPSSSLNPSLSEKKRVFALADEFAPSKRELKFMKNIADYENFIQGEYGRAEKMTSDIEDQIRTGLKDIYAKADVEIADGGLRVLARSAKNTQLQKDAIQLVKDKTKKLNRMIYKNANNKDSAFVRNLFAKTRTMALSALDDDADHFAEAKLDERKFDSFVKGYRSNVDALLFNDPRRIEESIVQNFGNQVSIDLTLSQLDNKLFNRNILGLSLVSHPRGAYNGIQYDINSQRGFPMYKVLTPKRVMKDLDPTGITAKLLFGLYAVGELNRRVSELTDGKTNDAFNGLGLHHNAVAYFFPIIGDEIQEEEAISRAQRAQLKKDLS